MDKTILYVPAHLRYPDTHYIMWNIYQQQIPGNLRHINDHHNQGLAAGS